jgi:hypothetical protein
VVFGAEVVEAVNLMLAAAVGAGAVLVDYRVAVLVEFEADIAAGLYLVLELGQQKGVEKPHKAGFTASDRAGQH